MYVRDLVIFETDSLPFMKYIIFFFAIVFPLTLTAQTRVYDSIKYIEFNLAFATDTTSFESIDWEKEQLVSRFTLQGAEPLYYSIALINDTIANFSEFKNGKWQFQETLKHSGWAVRRVDENTITSEFTISDFDNDGDEDLICLVNTNMNGNMWTVIFLNDQRQHKLTRLYNLADETDIWNRPEYDAATGIINCTLDGSAYGASEESSFKLNYLTPIPLIKERQERYDPKYIEDFYYKGEKGKWKLVKHTKNR